MSISRTLVVSALFGMSACTGKDTPREPASVLVVSDSAGRIVSAAFPSPDGTQIAYALVVSGASSIFVSAADGTNPVQVSHGVWDTNPIWSPDGKWIAYQGEDPQFDLFVVPSDGSAPARQLTSGPAGDNPMNWVRDGSAVIVNRVGSGDEHPLLVPMDGGTPRRIGPVMQGNLHAAWSPDGSQLGFDLHQGGANTVWVLDSATGSAPRQLTTEGLENSPAQTMWSPDGKQIVYTSRRTGTQDIWTLDVATGQTRQLTNDVRDDTAPRWSPDGRWIAFISDRGGQRDLWLLPSAGGTATRLTNDAAVEASPRWAADGQSVYYQRFQNPVDLQLVPLAGGPARTLHSWEEFAIGSARLSPDGNTVIFDTDRLNNGEVLTIPVAGGEPTAFGSSPRSDAAPRYSPDGSQVAIVSDRGGTPDIWIVPVAGGEARNLTSAPGDESEAYWSPDGTRIAFASSRDVGGSDLWVIAATGGTAKRLTSANLRPTSVQWSPDGKYLYFIGQKPGGTGATDFYRVAASGGQLKAFGANPTIGSSRLSRDGKQVVYTSFERGWAFLDLMSADGGPSKRLTKDTANVYHAGAVWTLDDSLLVVAALDLVSNRDAAELWIYRLSDGSWTQLTHTLGTEDPMGLTPDKKDVLVLLRTDRSQIRRVSVAELVGGQK